MAGIEEISAVLGPKLSPEAAIILPGGSDFAGITARWREHQAPAVSVVVKVATESDVQETVRYADEHNIPFIARSGGHGATGAMSKAKSSIQIDFRSLNHVKLSEDGKSAAIGGGANVKDTVDKLAALRKRTDKLVGISALALGRGHGWLQGQYGLVADQVVSARLVLPNGNLVTVSDDSYPDLFWAIKGAGHNFGLVTEWEFSVYNDQPQWSYEIFLFSGDKLEALYSLANEQMKTQPPELIYWGYIIKPILWFGVIYNGSQEAVKRYAKPFYDIGPLNVQTGKGQIHDLAVITYQDLDGPGCAYGMTSLRYPIGLKSHNIAAVRKVYNEIDETFRRVPEVAGSFFLLEGYSTQAVEAIDPDATAFPHRNDKILITSYIMYTPNDAITPLAQEFGKKLRQYLLDGSDVPAHLRAYVNYADGDEPLPAVYGWDDGRLEKLKKLKAKWDPKNTMRYYVPIE
ncbi:FAD-binding domain-containing protein [Xylaria palmicola]|nr:FAD-binding domain-containing protein [Xylaria palmicola]